MDVTEGAMGVTDRKFTRRQYVLYEAVMDGDCTIDEAIAMVREYATEIRMTTWPSGSPGRSGMH